MNKLLILLLLSVLACSFNWTEPFDPAGSADDPKKTDAAKMSALTKKYYLNLSGRYASPYKTILEHSYCGPDCFTTYVGGRLTEWNHDTSAAVLFEDYHSIVHESVHGYNFSKSKIDGNHYLVEPGIEISLNSISVFRSCEIRKVIAIGADDQISRYDTYVSESSSVSANRDGIYGLLDEFSAYNNGTRCCVLGAETAMQKHDTILAERFIEAIDRNFEAYYEFSLFITWYLKTAELYYPETYEALQADTNIRTAYTLLDQSYSETISRMFKAEHEIRKHKGRISDERTVENYHSYSNQMLKVERQWLDRFRMPGINKSNYNVKQDENGTRDR